MNRFTKVKDQSGVAAVEFALILPLLLIILFGIIEFALIFYDKHMITNASREGARYGIVMANPSKTQAEITEVASRYLSSNPTGPANYALLLGFPRSVPTISITPGSCPTPHNPFFGNDELSVTVSYNYNFLVFPNVLGLISGGSTSDSLTLTATTKMMCE